MIRAIHNRTFNVHVCLFTAFFLHKLLLNNSISFPFLLSVNIMPEEIEKNSKKI